MDKLDVYTEILGRLVSETVRCSPQSWNVGALSIESDGVRLTYRLKNEESPDKAVISEQLRDLIDEFYVRMAQRGEVWSGAQIQFTRLNGEIKYEIAFQYPPKASQPKQQAPEPKRPWWKIIG
jgi:hypothetical protein